MKKLTAPRSIAYYWVTTALVALAFLTGGIGDILQPKELLDGMRHLGYPDYFGTILGGWKLLGGIAILAPRLPRVKEWAYAGIVFDLSGAALSHAIVGDPIAKMINPLIILGLAAASWALRPESRRLESKPIAVEDAEKKKGAGHSTLRPSEV